MTCKTRQEFEEAKKLVELIHNGEITKGSEMKIKTTVDDWLE